MTAQMNVTAPQRTKTGGGYAGRHRTADLPTGRSRAIDWFRRLTPTARRVS